MAGEAKKKNPGAWARFDKLDARNPYQQALAASYGIKAGHGSHWATYGKAQEWAKSYNYKPSWQLGPGGSTGGPGGVSAAGAANMQRGGAGRTLTEAQKNLLATPTDLGGSDLMPGGRISSIKNLLESSAQGQGIGGGGQATAAAQSAYGPAKNGYYRTPNGLIAAQRPGEADWQFLVRLGGKGFGLENDPGNAQTTGGSHSANSLHYDGRAVDWGDARNTHAQLDAFYKWLNARRNSIGIEELIWRAPGHYDHLHLGIR